MPASRLAHMMRNNGALLRKQVLHPGIEELPAGDRSKEVILPT